MLHSEVGASAATNIYVVETLTDTQAGLLTELGRPALRALFFQLCELKILHMYTKQGDPTSTSVSPSDDS